jgi:natural product biosynthesis luciferase-like monooxygenase protein
MKFSLFYFSGDGSTQRSDKYRLLTEGAKFADRNGFHGIWMPERHFHAFGGLYPNPAVTGAAIAMITEQLTIRSGSVVLPLQNPLRVAEEWAVVDNLSNGRAEVCFASGWHPDDFVFYPEKYADRKTQIWSDIQTVQKLWAGQSIDLTGGAGNTVSVQTFPNLQGDPLPVWITALAEQTFIDAGKYGINVLTSPLYQSLDELSHKINRYRQSLRNHGHDPKQGKIAVMLHTFMGEDVQQVKARVKEPFGNYMKTHYSLVENLVKSLNLPMNLDQITEEDLQDLFTFSFESYFNSKVLMGTTQSCRSLLDRMVELEIDEVAALIDFGVEVDWVLESLEYLKDLKEIYEDNQVSDSVPQVSLGTSSSDQKEFELISI